MANTSQYRLHAQYENIPLEFGSPILVNNSNITDEYALILLQRPGAESLFTQMPTAEDEVITGTTSALRLVTDTPADFSGPISVIEGHDDILDTDVES